MASATKTYTNDELLAVLMLSKTQTVDFTSAQIPAGAATTLAQAYLDLTLARDTAFPFGVALQHFANAQVPIIKAAIVAAG